MPRGKAVRANTSPEIDGILVVDKETGPTSHDVVASVRRLIGQRRVGHCGTLDPLATGVLVVCLGRYTRLSQWLGNEDKEYLATFVLGQTSTTGDAQGELAPGSGQPLPATQALREALGRLEGSRLQTPPAYSAVKVNGVPSYRLAREHEAVALAPRRVQVQSAELLTYEPPQVTVRVHCGKGTYVRALADELGADLGCGAYVAALRRLRAGALGLDRAMTLKQLAAELDGGTLQRVLVPVVEALAGLPQAEVGSEARRAFCHGNPVAAADLGSERAGSVAVFADGVFCGIGSWDSSGRWLAPRAVLADSDRASGAAAGG